MTGTRTRADMLRTVAEQLRPILETSSQGIYVFLDDDLKCCNQRFAELLGYASPAAWDQRGSFTELYVTRASQHALVAAYQRAVGDAVASTIEVSWKRRDGTPLPSIVQLVPIALDGELMALHFVTPR